MAMEVDSPMPDDELEKAEVVKMIFSSMKEIKKQLPQKSREELENLIKDFCQNLELSKLKSLKRFLEILAFPP